MTFVTRRPLDTGDSEQDFLVKLDEAIPMSAAYKKGTAKFEKHDEWNVWSLTLKSSGQVGEGGIERWELLRNYDIEEHGWWLWGAWFCIGLLLLITKRYAKKAWHPMHFLHAFLGYFVLIVTLVFVYKV